MAGRPPLPAQVHLLHGNPSKKPEAELAQPNEPKVTIPDPPEFLSELAREEWKRIAPELEQLGLIAEVYMASLAAYCVAFADWARARAAIERLHAEAPDELGGYVQMTASGYQQITARLVVANQAEQRMLKFAQEFGLTPSSRTRVTMGGNPQLALFPDQGDPMAAYTRAAASLKGAKS
jgi:P27 family predicted phage terminase small subunit